VTYAPHSSGPFPFNPVQDRNVPAVRVFGPALFRELGEAWVLVGRATDCEIENTVHLVLNGDEDARNRLVVLLQGRLLQWAKREVGSQDAEEAAQCAQLRILDKLPTWRQGGPVQGWIRTVALRAFKSFARARRSRLRRVRFLEEVQFETRDSAASPQEQAASLEMRSRVRTAMDRLTDLQRQVFEMRCDGLGLDAIRKETGKTHRAIKHLLERARCSLRQALGGTFETFAFS